ncbi:MAG: NADH-quinone oxidoreductase subunit NuoE [Spirochaetes bacterium]|nr:NADH-quinone oxidoreductase subunit NuoE [Spirochaetota bacterium]
MEDNNLNYIENAIFEGVEDIKLSEELMEHIEKWKDKPGNLIMILHRVQQIFGYIPLNVAVKIAKELNIHLAKIYGVITFYHFFKTEKPGRHKISICMGTACYLKGAEKISDELQELLGIEIGQTTKDGLFTLETVRCIGCCGLAPVMTIDDEVYGNLKPEDIAGIISKYTNIKTGV